MAINANAADTLMMILLRMIYLRYGTQFSKSGEARARSPVGERHLPQRVSPPEPPRTAAGTSACHARTCSLPLWPCWQFFCNLSGDAFVVIPQVRPQDHPQEPSSVLSIRVSAVKLAEGHHVSAMIHNACTRSSTVSSSRGRISPCVRDAPATPVKRMRRSRTARYWAASAGSAWSKPSMSRARNVYRREIAAPSARRANTSSGGGAPSCRRLVLM